ncbi:MAG: L-threonylcarbamoyladenylate synthase [Mariprofundaceae bacterium]
MFERLRLHPDRPQARLIRHAAECMRKGVAAVVPTETTYALMALPDAHDAVGEISRLRCLDAHHWWSLMCSDLSQASGYVRMDNEAHRILKRCLPGPYTFILPAKSQLSKRVFGKRKDVGIRMSQHAVCRALLEELNAPLLATTLVFPDESDAAVDPDVFIPRLKASNMLVLDAGWGGIEPTTVVDLCADAPLVIREGAGDWAA